MSKHKRYAKNILINTSLQYRYAIYFGLTIFVLLGTLATFIVHQVAKMRMFMQTKEIYPPEAPLVIDHYLQSFVYVSIAYIFVATFTAIIFSFLISHRIAGPMYAIVTYIRQLREKKFEPLRKLRKGDELSPIMDELVGLAEDLKKGSK